MGVLVQRLGRRISTPQRLLHFHRRRPGHSVGRGHGYRDQRAEGHSPAIGHSVLRGTSLADQERQQGETSLPVALCPSPHPPSADDR